MAEQADSIAGSVVRGTFATIGAEKTANVWAGSAAARQAFRAGCISTSLNVATPVGVSRTTAVFVGTRVSNYVNQGLIPGALTVLALYDGYRAARWAYNWYSCTNTEH